MPSCFDPLVDEWFSETLGSPSDIQELAWPAIVAGGHVLLTAPTGSGKTLAAFLASLDALISGRWEPGKVRVLYISPLKALNADIGRNLLQPLSGIRKKFGERGRAFPDITVAVRSGDTSPAERARMLRHPPSILITTPESLALIMNSPRASLMLSGVKTVILDEIHALAPGKRGAFLMIAVERLALLAGEFQRILLSATVNPVELVASFGAGFTRPERGSGGVPGPRSISILRSVTPRRVELSVISTGIGEKDEKSRWPSLTRAFLEIIRRNRSTLFFVNSRRFAEKVAFALNQEAGNEVAYAHHGSLSREVRSAVEERMKEGKLAAVVATNSLELGIDIGSIDEVVLVQSPHSVSSTLQRVGRSGHRLAATSRGTLFPTHGMDFLFASVTVPAAARQEIERLHIPERPLDVLAQAVAGMTAMATWKTDELYGFFRSLWTYRNLTRREFDLVLDMLAGRYSGSRIRELSGRVFLNTEDGTVRAREGTLPVLYSSGGTIPDRGSYSLRINEGGAWRTLGDLDEEFVWERKTGDTFSLGTQVWKIVSMDSQFVNVVPGTRSVDIIPFWRGDRQYLSFPVCLKILELLERFSGSLNGSGFRDYLEREASFDRLSIDELVAWLSEQEHGAGLPLRHRLLVERYLDASAGPALVRLVFHTMWGGRVNEPFALACQAAARASGFGCEVYTDNGCVLFTFADPGHAELFLASFRDGSLVRGDSLVDLLRQGLEGSGLFGALFRESAGRALLLPRQAMGRRVPLWVTRQKAKRLFEAVSGFPDFPIVLEAWREILGDIFDLETLRMLLDELESGEIEVSVRATLVPSPFARSALYQETNRLIYEGDAVRGGPTGLSDDLVAMIAGTPSLRPMIAADIAADFELRNTRLAPGYEPGNREELMDWLDERLFIPAGEWMALAGMALAGMALAGMAGEPGQVGQPAASGAASVSGADGQGGLPAASGEPVSGGLPGAAMPRAVRFLRPGEAGEPGQAIAGYLSRDSEALPEPEAMLARFLPYYPPLGLSRIASLLPWPREELETALREMVRSGSLVSGFLTEGRQGDGGQAETEYCDRGSYEALLRIQRHRNRPSLPVLPARALQDFLAIFSGAAERTAESAAERTAGGTGGQGREEAGGSQSGRPGGEAGLGRLETALERLSGYPAQASLWESDLLPARLSPYRPLELDGLFRNAPLAWFGAGGGGTGKTGFCLLDDLELFLDRGKAMEGLSGKARALLGILAPGPSRRGDLERASGLHSGDFASALRELAFAGLASSPGFAPVRSLIEAAHGQSLPDAGYPLRGLPSADALAPADAPASAILPSPGGALAPEGGIDSRPPEGGIDSRPPAGGIGSREQGGARGPAANPLGGIPWPGSPLSRPGSDRRPAGWKRRSAVLPGERWKRREEDETWFALDAGEEGVSDEIDREELAAARARVALVRYGVVFRELLERETPALAWSRLFRVLRRMELSGEISGGRFFSGPVGIQFASKEALRLLKAGIPPVGPYWLNACDPASLAGTRLDGLEGTWPARLPGSRIVISGGIPAITVRRSGKELDIGLAPGDPGLEGAAMVLAAMPPFPGREGFRIEAVNGLDPRESPYEELLLRSGFERGWRTLNRY